MTDRESLDLRGTRDEAPLVESGHPFSLEGAMRIRRLSIGLAGLLVTPDGRQWHGDSGEGYRVGKGRRIAAARVDDAVLEQIGIDWSSEAAVKRATAAVRAARRR